MNIYVVQCHTYSGDNSISAFQDVDKAIRCVKEEMEIEVDNLHEAGRDVVGTMYNSFLQKGSVWVNNTDIYYDWQIEEVELR